MRNWKCYPRRSTSSAEQSRGHIFDLSSKQSNRQSFLQGQTLGGDKTKENWEISEKKAAATALNALHLTTWPH